MNVIVMVFGPVTVVEIEKGGGDDIPETPLLELFLIPFPTVLLLPYLFPGTCDRGGRA